ncbi:hypothetical protein [Chromobacterium paludis]|uniref:Uncharacterized protein n=1 Tax=Chromobacterium paludis TaxID=2605945 RepID=A0A5C1DEP9_9NEIS|nr:hypothetical protein [Chromobacterium paludis]QEL54429.1 hypothetical protein FYK34_01995 [Chromobacterium paludis]
MSTNFTTGADKAGDCSPEQGGLTMHIKYQAHHQAWRRFNHPPERAIKMRRTDKYAPILSGHAFDFKALPFNEVVNFSDKGLDCQRRVNTHSKVKAWPMHKIITIIRLKYFIGMTVSNTYGTETYICYQQCGNKTRPLIFALILSRVGACQAPSALGRL